MVQLLYFTCRPSRNRHTETPTDRQAGTGSTREMSLREVQLHRGACRWTMNVMASGRQRRSTAAEESNVMHRQTDRHTDRQTDRRTYRQTHTDRCMDKQTHRQRSKRQTGATGERAAAEGGYMGMGVANLLHQSPSINGTRAVSVGVVFLSCLCHISIFAHLSQLQYQAAIVCAHCEANSALWGYRYVTVLRETALS